MLPPEEFHELDLAKYSFSFLSPPGSNFLAFKHLIDASWSGSTWRNHYDCCLLSASGSFLRWNIWAPAQKDSWALWSLLNGAEIRREAILSKVEMVFAQNSPLHWRWRLTLGDGPDREIDHGRGGVRGANFASFACQWDVISIRAADQRYFISAIRTLGHTGQWKSHRRVMMYNISISAPYTDFCRYKRPGQTVKIKSIFSGPSCVTCMSSFSTVSASTWLAS